MSRSGLGLMLLGLSIIPLGLTAGPGPSAPDCGAAYVGFLERLSRRTDAISGAELVSLNRRALRIYDACGMGHLDHAETYFQKLSGS